MICRTAALAIVAAAMLAPALAAQQGGPGTGTVSGRVVEAGSQRPLAAVEVLVEATSQRALTDSAGRYRLPGVPAGSYALRADLLGYVPAVRTDVVVRPDRSVLVDLELTPAPLVLAALHARPAYFAPRTEGSASRISLAAEEIRRAPGSAGDVSRILYGLPAVAKVNDQSNGLAVRGGTPAENLFLLDGIAVPNINHFPTQGASSGPIGLLNVELIGDVEFQAGGFSAEYGDRLSSVLQVRLREGDPERAAALLSLDLTGAGVVVEGPLATHTSGLVSLRRSYLDLLVGAFDVGATVAPHYGDYAAKLHTELSSRHRLSALALWADDHFQTDLEQALDNGMSMFGRQDLLQGTTGLSWSALWSDGWLSQTSLAHNYARFDEDFTETAARASLFRNRSSEHALTLRHRTRAQVGRASSVTFGGEVAALRTAYDNRYLEHVSPLGDTVPEQQLRADPHGMRAGAFVSLTHELGSELATTLGLRLDHAALTGNTTLSPRAALAWSPTARTTLSLSGGVYRQTLPLLLLANEGHRELEDPLALHAVASLSHLLAPDLRLTVEAYRKEYRRLPLDPDEPTLLPLDEVLLGNPFYSARERLTANGRAAATGLEVLLQKKLTGSVYALLSGAWSSSRYRGLDGRWRPRATDNRLVISGEGGWRIDPRWELSARWIYAGGPPFTPLDEAASRAANRTVLDDARIAGVRFPAYHSLNLRADRRFLLRGSSVVAYLSVWNAYNRANVASYYWNTERQEVDITCQWRLLPVFGVEWGL